MTAEWAAIIITAGLIIAGSIFTLLVFILKGIQQKQDQIWTWAITETAKIERLISTQDKEYRKEIRDLRQALRHGLRALNMQDLEVAKLFGPKGADLVKSIENDLENERKRELGCA